MTTELKEHLNKEEIRGLHNLIESLGICKIIVEEEQGIKSYSQHDINKYLLEQLEIQKTKMNELISTINDHENRIKKLEEGGLTNGK